MANVMRRPSDLMLTIVRMAATHERGARVASVVETLGGGHAVRVSVSRTLRRLHRRGLIALHRAARVRRTPRRLYVTRITVTPAGRELVIG